VQNTSVSQECDWEHTDQARDIGHDQSVRPAVGVVSQGVGGVLLTL